MINNAPDPAMVERFQTAVGRRLSGLQVDPWLARKIIGSERQENRKTEHRWRAAAAVAVLLGGFILTFVTINHTGIIISDKGKQEQYTFSPVESPSPSPGIILPGQDAFGDGTAICFGGPQIIHYPDDENGEYVNRMENALNLRALLCYDILQESPAFQSIPLDGAFYPIEMEDDWLILGSQSYVRCGRQYHDTGKALHGDQAHRGSVYRACLRRTLQSNLCG